jgi:hypothetical protein
MNDATSGTTRTPQEDGNAASIVQISRATRSVIRTVHRGIAPQTVAHSLPQAGHIAYRRATVPSSNFLDKTY